MKKEYGRMGKRIAAVLLSVAMAASMMPSMVLADGREQAEDGFLAKETLKNSDFSGGGVEADSAYEPSETVSGFTAEEDETGGFAAAEEAEEGLAAGKESSSFEAVEEIRDTSLTGTEYSSVDTLNKAIENSNGTEASPAVFTIAPGGIDVTKTIVINPGKHVKLTGGTLRRGNTFTKNENQIIKVTGNQTAASSLVLEDITVDGMSWELADDKRANLVYVKGADFTMEAGTVLQNNNATALYVESTKETAATAVMKDGTITNNSCPNSFGGGVRIMSSLSGESATFEMHGGVISGNHAYNGGGIGGGVISPNSKVDIRGGEISGNTAGNSTGGGGIFLNGTLVISGGKISGNTATDQNGIGGGVYKGGNGDFTMTGGEISGNTAGRSGANVFDNTYSYKFTMSGTANIPVGLAVNSRSSDYISLPEALQNPVKIDKHADDVSGSYVAVGDNYTLTEADLAKFKYPDNTCIFRLDTQNNRIVLAYPSIDVNYELTGMSATDLPDSAETKVEFQIKLFLSEGYALPASVTVTSGQEGTPGTPVEGVTWEELSDPGPSGGLLTIPEVPTDGPLKITVKAKKMDATLKTLGYTYKGAEGEKTVENILKTNTYTYDVTLPRDITSNTISLTPTKNDENATVKADAKVTLDQHGKATANIEVTAEDGTTTKNYTVKFKKPLPHEVTVEDSHAGEGTGAGFYYEGDTVTVNAGNRSDYAFAGWTTTSAQVSFADADQAETTFEMPDEAVTVTATWLSTDATLKTLGYSYVGAEGNKTIANILKADTDTYNVRLPEDITGDTIGLTFEKNDANASVKADATVTLKGDGKATANIEVTAQDGKTKKTYTINFIKPYKVTVEDSHAGDETGAGFYYEGDTVTVKAGSRDGYAFAEWTTSDQVSFADKIQVTTTFEMPAKPVKVTATWLSTDATLQKLGYSYVGAQGVVTEANILKDNTYIYNVELPKDITKDTISLTFTKNDANASVSEISEVTLDENGKATAVITVTAEDGKTKKTYTVNFIKPHEVTVEDSHSEKTGAGFYYEGKTVTVNAGSRDGYVFAKWTTSDQVSFADETKATTTFTMPAKPVKVTATWLSTDATLKTLKYVYRGANESITVDILAAGSDTYNVELPKDITEDTIGLTFEKNDANASVSEISEVTLDQYGKATAVITVTAEDGKTIKTYTVNFIKAHEVTVEDSYTKEETGAGLYYEGDKVTIKAGSRGSHVFSKWTSSSEEVTFADESKAETTFKMPAKPVTVTAHWIYISPPEPEPPIVDRPTKENPDQPTTAETKTIEAGEDGQASLSPDDVERALRAAQQDAAEKGAASGTAVVVPVQFSEASAEMGITIPAQVLDELVTGEAEYLKLQTNGSVSFSLPKQSLAGLSRMDGDGGIVIRTKEAGGLDESVQKAIGDRPVLDTSVYRMENGSLIPLETLEDGSFTMKLSYTPAAGENPAGIYSIRVDEDGTLHWLEAAYEEREEAVSMDLMQGGIYGVGYLDLAATKVSFSGRTTTQVTIAWQPVEAAEGYTIWYRPEGQTKMIRKIIPSADRLSWDCRNLQPGTKHFYTVRPWVKTAGGYVFGPASKVLRGTTKPLAAHILKASMENGKIKTVLQGPAAGADRYAFCYSKTPDFDPFGVGIRTSYTTRSFPVNNTKTGYYVRVRSYRDLGSGKYVYGDWSNQVRVD